MQASSDLAVMQLRTAYVRQHLQLVLETGSKWAEGGNHPKTGVSCWGLVRYAFQQGGIMLPESACEADAFFVPVSPPFQPWDMVVVNFSGAFYGPSHVGLLMTEAGGYHCSQATNGLAWFALSNRLWQRRLRQVVRLRALVCG